MEYFTLKNYPDAFYVRSGNGRRVVLCRSFRVTTLPTTIHGNFWQFLRQLHSTKTPFSLQVVHVPAADASAKPLPTLPVSQRARYPKKPASRRVASREELKTMERNLQLVLDDAIERGVLTTPINAAFGRLIALLRVRQQFVAA